LALAERIIRGYPSAVHLRLWPLAPLALLPSCAATPPPSSPAAPAPSAPVVQPAQTSLSGVWLGTLRAGGKGLRLQVHLDLGKSPPSCMLDSLDQDAMGIPCNQVLVSPTALSLAVPLVHGSLTGPISADGNTVYAAWAQGGAESSLVLRRQGVAPASSSLASDPGVVQTARPSLSGI
jgi:hypothetical protein